MFASFALTILFSALVTLADVVPSSPGPGDVFKTGATCRTDWSGDSSSNTVWKGMSIELMSGSNLGMVHLTTVATNQDGTVSGFFTYPCPDVTPNAAIYFYQYGSPNTPNKTWTTRFTIAAANGSTVPPANAVQPDTNAPIPWGVGALKDPTTAVAAPSYIASGSSGSPPTSTPSATANNTLPLMPTTITNTATQTGQSTPATTTTSVVTTSATNTTSKNNAAMGSVVVDSRVWGVVLTLVISAVGFSVLL